MTVSAPGQEGLFGEAGVLRLLGCTAREIREGFALEHNRGEHTLCHVDSLRDSLQQTPVPQVYEAFTRGRAGWIKTGFIKRRGSSLLDATKIAVDGEYEGAGAMTVREAVIDQQGKRHRRKVGTKGFNLVPLSYLLPQSTLLVVMAYRLLPGQPHEITASDALRDEVLEPMGEGALRRRLARGFGDGERLGRWQTRGMDGLVPVTHTMGDLGGYARVGQAAPDERIGLAERRGVKDAQGQPLDDVRLIGFSGVETLESDPGPLNGLLVTAFRGRELRPEEPWGAITTLPGHTPAEVLAAFDAYADRALGENAEYRELKQGYRLPTFIGKDASAIAAHVLFEGLLCSVVALYRQQRASRYFAEGVRRLRRLVWRERLQVVI